MQSIAFINKSREVNICKRESSKSPRANSAQTVLTDAFIGIRTTETVTDGSTAVGMTATIIRVRETDACRSKNDLGGKNYENSKKDFSSHYGGCFSCDGILHGSGIGKKR